jgi:hypothetical protein
MHFGFLIFLCSILSFLGGSAAAATWYVDQSGSAGVPTIQEAVDAAASGDTIRVGPGFYDDIHFLPPPWEEDLAVVQVRQEELTIIGAGAGETIIGQQIDWEPSQGYPRGIVGGLDNGRNGRLNVHSVGIEGLYHGLLVQGGGVLTVQNCRFNRTLTSILLYASSVQAADSAFVENCEFGTWDSPLSSNHIWTLGWNYLSAKSSSFFMREIGINMHVSFDGRELSVDDCQFNDGRLGVGLACEEAFFNNVVFNSQEYYGVRPQLGAVTIVNCQINDARAGLFENDYEGVVQWAVTGLSVTNVSESTLGYRSLGEGYIRNSILARGDTYVVKYAFSDQSSARTDFPVFDMSDNWWGTTDPDSIRASIYDANDDPSVGVLVEFEPFKTEPLVGVKKSSLSGFKALFR